MSNFDRGSDKPIVCRIDSSITREHANRHFPVALATDGETGKYSHPKVALQSAANDTGRIWGELGSVDEDTGLCQVYRTGLMYFRSNKNYTASLNGHVVTFSDAANYAKVNAVTVLPNTNIAGFLPVWSASIDPIMAEGSFLIQEDGNDIRIIKGRRR